MDWKKNLFEEKNLLGVYWKSRKVASARLNRVASWCVLIIACIYLSTNLWKDQILLPGPSLILTIRRIGEIGLAYSTNILGFLIAGFAIFFSVIRPEIFAILGRLPHTKEGISRLQYILFNFIFIFIHYIFFLAICIFIEVGLADHGAFSGLARLIAQWNAGAIVYAGSLFLAVLLAWLVFLVMLLKSFVWNIYQAVLLAIAVDAELREKADCKKDEHDEGG